MKWAFIYTLESAAEAPRIDRIGTLVCAGIRDLTHAPEIARQFLDEGVELIELCGGFGGTGLALVVEAVENKIPVGAVFYDTNATAGLARLFGENS